MKQRSIFPISGSTEHFTFYSTKYGHLVRRRSKKIAKKRIATDPRFEGVRKTNAEFSTVMNSVKLISASFGRLIQHAKTGDTHSRLVRLLFSVLKTDKVNQRGSRKVCDGEVEMLERFEFNDKVKLDNVLHAMYAVSFNRRGSDVDLLVEPFIPMKDLKPPSGATHYRFVMGAADLDFEKQETNYVQSMSEQFAISADRGNGIHLQVKLAENSTGTRLVMAGIEFYEQRRDSLTLLPQAALRIVHASKPYSL